jgi:glyoxylase-like metal-dependent hydrolase (beta-lactamase superfamily II)
MYNSMQKLRRLPGDTIVYAGHNYGGHVTSIASEMAHGALAPLSKDQWLSRFRPEAG